MYTIEKYNISMLCILCTLMPKILPLLTLTSIHTWYEQSTHFPPRAACQPLNTLLAKYCLSYHATYVYVGLSPFIPLLNGYGHARLSNIIVFVDKIQQILGVQYGLHDLVSLIGSQTTSQDQNTHSLGIFQDNKYTKVQ